MPSDASVSLGDREAVASISAPVMPTEQGELLVLLALIGCRGQVRHPEGRQLAPLRCEVHTSEDRAAQSCLRSSRSV
jgi:hypothetical protein